MTDKSFQPTLAGLRAFVAVAEKRHFGSAATTLGVSQSTLSQALAALETGLGSHLVERSTRRVRVTPEGMQLLPLAQAVIDAAEAFTAAAAGASDPLQGSMRLGLIPTVAPYVLPAVLAGLAQRLPALTLRVVEDQTERLLTVAARRGIGCGLDFTVPFRTRRHRRSHRDPDLRRRFRARATARASAVGQAPGTGVGVGRVAAAVARRGSLPARSGPGRLPESGSKGRPCRHPGGLAGDGRAMRDGRIGGDADPTECGARRGRAQPAWSCASSRLPARAGGSAWCSARRVVATTPIGGSPQSSGSWSAPSRRCAWSNSSTRYVRRMEKVIAVLMRAEPDDDWCDRQRGPVADALLGLGIAGLSVNVRDSAVAPLADDADDSRPAGGRGGEPVDPAVLRRTDDGGAEPARRRMRATRCVPGDRIGPAANRRRSS